MPLNSLNVFHWLRSSVLRRWMVGAFLLGMAAAYASPVIAPRSMELLCSTNGAMRLLSQTADGDDASFDATHCALCAPAAPPPEASPIAAFSPLANASQRTPASALAALTRPPLPARGPPDFS